MSKIAAELISPRIIKAAHKFCGRPKISKYEFGIAKLDNVYLLYRINHYCQANLFHKTESNCLTNVEMLKNSNNFTKENL